MNLYVLCKSKSPNPEFVDPSEPQNPSLHNFQACFPNNGFPFVEGLRAVAYCCKAYLDVVGRCLGHARTSQGALQGVLALVERANKKKSAEACVVPGKLGKQKKARQQTKQRKATAAVERYAITK